MKSELANAADVAVKSDRLLMIDAPFRLPIDRTFSMEGHGTVVTGSVASGRTRIGDELMIEPGGFLVRVRGLQNHDQAVEEIHRGQRAAINLAGIHHDQSRRGQELAEKGYLQPSRLLTVNLMLLTEGKKPLKDRTRARLHVGTAELICSVRLLDREALEPGDQCPAQLFLGQPAVTIWNQPFVLRSESPVTTIGGGQILNPNAERIRKADAITLEKIQQLQSEVALTRAAAAAFFAGLREMQPNDFTRHAGVKDAQQVQAQLVEQGELVEFKLSAAKRQLIHRDLLQMICDRFAAALKKLHEHNPLRSTFEKTSFLSGFTYLGDLPLLEAILRRMQQDGTVKVGERGISLVGHGPSLSQNEQKLMTQLLDWFREAGIASPSVDDCKKKATKNRDSIPQLVQLAVNNGDLVEVAQGYFLHADVERELRDKLSNSRELQNGATMSELRDLMGTTRKYAVPICEYFDKIGFTRRQDDLRLLAGQQQAIEVSAD